MTTIDTKFRTKTGRLNKYSFSCGYIEQKSTNHDNFRNGDLYTEMYHEGACYHVRQFDRRPNAKTFRVFWESFVKLSEARDLFNKQEGDLIVGKSPPIGKD